MKPADQAARRRSPAGRRLILGAILAGLLSPALAATCPVPQRVANGVYLLAAQSPVATPQNGGRTGNSVILIGTSGITIIDPGPTLQAGRELWCGVRRVSHLPVVALVNTHPHPNQALANGAFPGAVIYASRRTAETMAERCSACRERLKKTIGTAAMAGTSAVIPDQVIDHESRAAPGGRALTLLPLGDAHSRGDLAVIDHASGSLISGDLGNSTVLPELIDGNTAGWIAALQKLLARPGVSRVIPGYGPPAPLASLKTPLAYLQTLHQYAEGEVGKGEMLAPNLLPEVLRPFGHEAAQLLNLQHAMREAEERWWSQAPSGSRQDDGR